MGQIVKKLSLKPYGQVLNTVLKGFPYATLFCTVIGAVKSVSVGSVVVYSPVALSSTDVSKASVNFWCSISLTIVDDPTKDLSFVSREARLQDTKNRQNSIETEDGILQAKWALEQKKVVKASQEAYNWAIENGIAKEQARAVLPEGLIESRLYMTGTLRSWMHFVELRGGNGTQKEHTEIALQCKELLVSAGADVWS